MGVTLREACRRLGIHDRHWLRGVVDGRGIRLQPVGRSLCMTEGDFKRLQRIVEKLRDASAA